ncbi:exodeoxyribonuclease III [Bacillaceae bacterium S4-13-56]
MKLVSWNVNGIRACLTKGFLDFFHYIDADVFCIQESKCQEGQVKLELDGYYQYWNYAERKGYSGTAVFTKKEPLHVSFGLGEILEDKEGRVITLEFDSYFVVTVYTPNSKRDLSRLDYRLEWENAILKYIKQLDKQKPVILCGDLNVAHQEIDLKNAKSNVQNSGFTIEERGKMTEFLGSGFVDSFRYLYPERTDVYSWWSYMNKVRERNIGWRIDYFVVSNRMASNIEDSHIYCDIYGSDHCPVGLDINLANMNGQ